MGQAPFDTAVQTAQKVETPKSSSEYPVRVSVTSFDKSGRVVDKKSPDAVQHKVTLTKQEGTRWSEAAHEKDDRYEFFKNLEPALLELDDAKNSYEFIIDRTEIYDSVSALIEKHGDGELNAALYPIAEKYNRLEARDSLAAFMNKNGELEYFDVQVKSYEIDGYPVRVVSSDADGVGGDDASYFRRVVRALPSNS